MLSEQDKQDMLADEKSASRRAAFRKLKEQGPVSGQDYLVFLETMYKLSPKSEQTTAIQGKDFRL